MSILDKVDSCIERSTTTLEKVCPHDNVCLGIKPRDPYHKENAPKFSMFTASEMLWAITSSGSYPKTHYLAVELLTAINTEIDNDYFVKQDRLLAWAYLLLSMTCAGQPILLPIYLKSLEKILDAQKDSGAWGTYSSGDEDTRATSLCVIALSECYHYVGKTSDIPFSKLGNAISKACKWLCTKYSDDGYCKRKIISLDGIQEENQYIQGVELTAWVTYSLILSANYLGVATIGIPKLPNNIKKAIKWLSSLDIDKVATTPEIELEIYKKGAELIYHEYGAGSLEILVLALVEYRICDSYEYIKGLDECINKSITRFLKNENEGKWYDKNTDSFSRIWTVSYAIKVLMCYKNYVLSKEKFKIELKRNVKFLISSICTKLHKYVFNLPLIIIYFIIGICVIYFRDFFNDRVNFINSTAVGFSGLLLSAIGVFLSIYYGRKGS